jgi:hypothetical protein
MCPWIATADNVSCFSSVMYFGQKSNCVSFPNVVLLEPSLYVLAKRSTMLVTDIMLNSTEIFSILGHVRTYV